MSLNSLFILLITHGIPILFFMYMATVILLRNYRKAEHLLISAMCIGYLLMFVEEFIRNIAYLEYSPFLSSAIFSSTGLLTVCLGLHFTMIVSKLDDKLPNWLTPSIYYVPMIAVFFNIVTGARLFSTQSFVKVGMWNYPIYNNSYYLTLFGSVLAIIVILLPLIIAQKKSTPEQGRVYQSFIWGISLVGISTFILGTIQLQGILPPYPYIYAGMIFCLSLRQVMQKSAFLEQYDKRFEKLFSINPDAIILLDAKHRLREANPVAQAFFNRHQVQYEEVFSFFSKAVKHNILKNETVRNLEVDITIDGTNYHLLINVDQISIELESYRMLIIRDMTALKEQQHKIEFLAYHDPLTKLPNRRYFFEELEEIFPEAYMAQDVLAIYLLDINNLKMLNDVRGHDAGDQSIQMLADVLTSIVGNHGIVARIGGDEFMVCLNETESMLIPPQFIELVQQQFSEATACFENIPLGTSIGYSHYPTDSKNINTLVTMADQSMYEMKKLKKVKYR